MRDGSDRYDERAGLLDMSLALLSFASGITDATAFLKLGTVFTSAMTGNTVLLGIALGQGRFVQATRAFDAFSSFLLGAALAAVLCRGRAHKDGIPPGLVPAFVLELLCLVGFVAVWMLVGIEGDKISYVLITLSALAMGIQGIAARHINAPGISTIVFTSTMLNIVMSLTHGFLRREPVPFTAKRQIGILFVYGIGAVLAGALIAADISVYVWLPLLAVAGAGASYEMSRLQLRRRRR